MKTKFILSGAYAGKPNKENDKFFKEILSTCFYSKSKGGIFKGLGFVPVKTICHYVEQNAEKLKDCPDNLESLFLPDYKFKVYYS